MRSVCPALSVASHEKDTLFRMPRVPAVVPGPLRSLGLSTSATGPIRARVAGLAGGTAAAPGHAGYRGEQPHLPQHGSALHDADGAAVRHAVDSAPRGSRARLQVHLSWINLHAGAVPGAHLHERAAGDE